MEKIAIDLTWVRHNKVGGTESFVRNLLDGIAQVNTQNITFVLLLTIDNADSFEKYDEYNCFQRLICKIYSENQIKRVLWQNFRLGSLLQKIGVRFCLEPVYGMPFLGCKKIKFVTVIHDLQALHYPQYFSKGRVVWMRAAWKNAIRSSEIVIAISQFVKNDILKYYKVPSDKIKVIYNAIDVKNGNCADDSNLVNYGIEKGKYYYTVSSLFPHKNLKTALLAIAELKRRGSNAFYPLVVSGIGGRKHDELDALINEHGLSDDIVFTSFVKNEERNMLYSNCKVFLFPSIFEGFGMPPLEAMALEVPVLTTRCASIEEVTSGLLNYVENPKNPEEWADKLESKLKLPNKMETEKLLSRYSGEAIAKEYINVLMKISINNAL